MRHIKIILFLFFIGFLFDVQGVYAKTAIQEKGGAIVQDETWSGKILITESISVPESVTLTIKPGTVIKFKQSRDYKNPNKLSIESQGRLIARGTAKKRIRFTSNAKHPRNGDWAILRLFGKTRSVLKYAIVEFGQQGVNMWQSDATISHSIIRWNNWEGLYAESYSTPLVEYNRVYQNEYNGMAMEQFNDAIVRYNIFEKSGTHGLHVDASSATVEYNIFRNNGAAGLSLDDESDVTATNNTLRENADVQLKCGEGENQITANENFFIPNEQGDTDCAESVFLERTDGEGIAAIHFGYKDIKKFDLGYTPGDRTKDKYQYVYPDDETRVITKKIGDGLGLTWSLAIDGNDIWTTTVSGVIYKLDSETGEILTELTAPSAQPWGMAFDGAVLWITDFAEKRTYSLDPTTGEELFSFDNPNQERGAKGLAWDGAYLYVMGWTTNIIYKMTRDGELVDTIQLSEGGGGLTWDGTYFWTPCRGGARICKYSTSGKLAGQIYSASEGTWDLVWQIADNAYGGFLWATQRTNENWHDDAKIFKLEIVDDSLIQ